LATEGNNVVMSFSGHWELRLISNVSRLGLKIVVMTREQGTGNREEDLGNFTFRYLCRFFSITYLYQVYLLFYIGVEGHEKLKSQNFRLD
jgi:hypothetical protein